MKNKRHPNRRGMAIEMAMAMMIIVFSLCALMTTVVTVSRKQTNIATARFTQTAQVDALGEQFVNGKIPTSDIFDCEVNGNILTVSKDGKTLLTVVVDGSGKIISWQH